MLHIVHVDGTLFNLEIFIYVFGQNEAQLSDFKKQLVWLPMFWVPSQK